MMVSEECFIYMCKDKSYKELLEEKSKLETYIERYNSGKISEEEKMTKPSPDTICYMYKQYLKELKVLIKEREKK